ncbi:MAG: hypothetical protein C5B56_05275 [Proteobacteria bacterium]|nr:MAG: hypothetical protein C5B56_05275 [Pseudomonadota bacterium]
MTQTATTEIELLADVQTASDALADALAAGEDTTDARKALDEKRAAVAKHQQAQRAAEGERKAAADAEADAVGAAAAAKATSAVDNTIAKVAMPVGVEPLAPAQHPLVAEAAAECARLRLEIERAGQESRKAADEVAALRKRADVKRHEAATIRSRRLAGHEQPDDAAQLHLLEADATDLDSLVQAAEQRLRGLKQPVVALEQRLADAEKKLATAQADAELHGKADRLRAIEAALIAGWRELRRSALERGHMNVPRYFVACADLRKVSYGQAV